MRLKTNCGSLYYPKNLGIKGYKVQLTQEIKPADHQKSSAFDDWAHEMYENDRKF